MCFRSSSYGHFPFQSYSEVSRQILTRAVYATETTAMTGIETTIGSPVARKNIKNKQTYFTLRWKAFARVGSCLRIV